MARTPFVAGNWKLNTTKATAIALAKEIAAATPKGVDVGIAPPFVYLDAVAGALGSSSVMLGAQDAYFETEGAFTGEISVAMLKDVGVTFALTGHSERRHVMYESSTLISQKAKAVYNGGLTLIHCVGEKLQERDANHTLSVVDQQLGELKGLDIGDPQRLVIAYEPVWAIGTGRVATDEQAQEVHAFIRGSLAKMFSLQVAEAVRIQYGGSVKPDNAKGLLGQTDIDGALVGGASLKASSFLAIATAAL